MDITSYILGSIAGAKSASGLKYLVVDELPETGADNTIYLVPKSTSKTNNYYDEYMYINNAWEIIGDTQIDLSNYVQKTDYATGSNAGVVRIYNSKAINTASDGGLQTNIVEYSNYSALNNSAFIGKGTLENVINGKGLITQISTLPTASADLVGKIYQYIGTTTNDYTNGYFYKCVSDGQDPATYSWSEIKVQEQEEVQYLITQTGDKIFFARYYNQPINDVNSFYPTMLEVAKELENGKNPLIIIDYKGNSTSDNARHNGLYYVNNYSSSSKNIELYGTSTYALSTAVANSYNQKQISRNNIRVIFTTAQKTAVDYTSEYLSTDEEIKYLAPGVNYSTPYTPEYNGSPATKKYVDDSIASAIGTALQGNY